MRFNKKASIMNNIIIQIILIGLVLILFMFSVSGKIESRGVKQQVLEKELSLLVSSGVPGMEFELRRINVHGEVSRVDVSNSRIFIDVEGLRSLKGYPYFSKYSVEVEAMDDKFVVRIK